MSVFILIKLPSFSILRRYLNTIHNIDILSSNCITTATINTIVYYYYIYHAVFMYYIEH